MVSGGTDVRDATFEDAAGIARVHVDSWRETYRGVLDERFFSDLALQRRTSFWSRYLMLDPRPGRLSVAERDDAIVGFASSGDSFGPDAEHGFPAARPLTLFSIYVLAAFHGTTVGQALFDAVVGDSPAQLWVLRGNDRAMAFYGRNGFVLDGTEYTDPADPNLVELRMIR